MGCRLGLIDYGMGNMHSVQQAFCRLERPLSLVRKPKDLQGCDALVLPGVGSFDPAMQQLHRTGLVPYLKDWAASDKPLLGICLGLQLFFESSDEGSESGLGLLKGRVERLPEDQGERIPHMGWAPLQSRNECPLLGSGEGDSWVYFVHSYAAVPAESLDLAAAVSFGQTTVAAIVWRGRLGACQFHPEKSAEVGHRMLRRWLEWIESGAGQNS